MRIIIILVILTLASSLFAQDEAALNYNQQAFQLSQKYLSASQGGDSQQPLASSKPEGWKSPGKALMLSAIMPGAGELYAGSPIKAALFFAVEVAAWTGVAIYQKEGNDKEKEYQNYANSHWDIDLYHEWMRNFPTWGDFISDYPQYTDPSTIPNEIYNLFEEDNNFTHQLPNTVTQQYYEMIGKYMTQFGPGWDDSGWQSSTSPYIQNEETESYYWPGIDQNPDPTVSDYWLNTNNAYLYQDIRYKSNEALDNATLFAELALINHVVSALDAGFTVRLKNKRLETALNVEPQMYCGHAIPMGKITVNW